MRVATVGIGGAGGRIVERLWRDSERRETTYLGAACVVDTDTEALGERNAVPDDRRHAFGLFETDGTGRVVSPPSKTTGSKCGGR